MTKINTLTARQIETMPKGKYSDGSGLIVAKSSRSAGRYIFRYSRNGIRKDISLGSINDLSLSDARVLRSKLARTNIEGIDPTAAIRSEKKTSAREEAEYEKRMITLRQMTKLAFEARQALLKNDGKAGRWMSPLETHVLPRLGELPIVEVTQDEIEDVLRPIWHKKPATAEKALQRLGIVFRHAIAKRLPVDSSAPSNAKIVLGAQRWHKIPIPSMPWSEVPKYFQSFGSTILEEALRFLILTACRSGEVRCATWEEIEDDVWTIPGSRTKTGREHRVPLTARMLDILKRVKLLSEGNYIFSSPRKLALSDMSMSVYMKRQGLKYRPHGFRSSFRTWAAEETDSPREICELCLGHLVGSEVELAYRRTDYLEKRRSVMQAWNAYVSGVGGTASQH